MNSSRSGYPGKYRLVRAIQCPKCGASSLNAGCDFKILESPTRLECQVCGWEGPISDFDDQGHGIGFVGVWNPRLRGIS